MMQVGNKSFWKATEKWARTGEMGQPLHPKELVQSVADQLCNFGLPTADS